SRWSLSALWSAIRASISCTSAPRSRISLTGVARMSWRDLLGPLTGLGRTQSMNDTPSTSSMVKYHSPSAACSSCSATRLGCTMSASARNSFLKRNSSRPDARRKSLRATSRWSWRSNARYTTPALPDPRVPRPSKRPPPSIGAAWPTSIEIGTISPPCQDRALGLVQIDHLAVDADLALGVGLDLVVARELQRLGRLELDAARLDLDGLA